MNRLQKKCVVASAGMHLLLGVVIFVGPGFMSSSSKPEPIREINFIPSIIVAENVAGGGNPNARPPAPVMQTPPSPPPPTPEIKPAEPPPEVKKQIEPEKPATTEPDGFAESKKPKKPQISLKVETRTKPQSSSKTTTNDTRAQEQKQLEARRRAGQEILQAASAIASGSASATAVDDDFGPGGGGPAYAGYDALVQMMYQRAWVKPSEVNSDSPITYATVTIARDGSVVPGSARIISRSGDSQMDASVQRTLERVTSIGRAFPDAMKGKDRTYKLKFDLQKSGLA